MKIENFRNVSLWRTLHIRRNGKHNTHNIKWSTYKKRQMHKVYNKVAFIINKILSNFNSLLNYANMNTTLLLLSNLITTQPKLTCLNLNNENSTNRCSYLINELKYASITESTTTQNIQKRHTNLKYNVVVYKPLIKIYQMYLFASYLLARSISTTSSRYPIQAENKIYTILRSPHTDKKSREQFIKKTYTVTHSIAHSNPVINLVENAIRMTMYEFLSGYQYVYMETYQ